jgi:hypothetical protein
MAAQPADDSAFTHRDATWIMSIISVWERPDGDPMPQRQWARMSGPPCAHRPAGSM